MKQTNLINDVFLKNLGDHESWERAAKIYFGGERNFHHILVDKILGYLDQFFSLQPKAKIVIACLDAKRLGWMILLSEKLSQAQFQVEIWTSTDLREACAEQKTILNPPKRLDLLIDCIAPLQFSDQPKELVQMIKAAQKLDSPKLALECPSGLNPNTGASLFRVLSVDVTLSMDLAFQGLWTGEAKAYVGQLALVKIFQEEEFVSKQKLMPAFEQPARIAYAHKHDYATVVVIAGQASMFGAAILAARAALAMGAGLVKIFYPEGVQPSFGLYPELMWYPQKISDERMLQQLDSQDILVVGPGLGEDAWANFVWQTIKTSSHRIVADASVLKFLAQEKRCFPNWILTPHPGEAASLLESDVASIQADRFAAIRRLNKRYAATCILKGSGTLVLGAEDEIQVCPWGNPGMASPGMGDVLAGLVAGAWAQGNKPIQAAVSAVALHAKAGDVVAQRALSHVALASLVIDYIQKGDVEYDSRDL